MSAPTTAASLATTAVAIDPVASASNSIDRPTHERIHALDVVRGVAVAGILFANVLVFFGLFAMPEDRLEALPTAAADRIAELLGHVFVEGKFYSIFSLLFGIGFGIQLSRGAEIAIPRFRRRLRALLAIGAVHAIFVWAGDILMLYALLGFSMPWFARKSDSALVRWSIGLLALPTTLYLVALLVWTLIGTDAPSASGDAMPAAILSIFERMGTGGIKDAFIANLVMLAGRWAELFATMRFPKVLGMFVLGLWTVRAGIALAPSAHRAVLVKWCIAGWAIGLPANVVGAWAMQRWDYLPPSSGGALGVAMQAIGFPMLAIAYACTAALLVANGSRIIGVFGPLGRMALTNYLMHSVVCVILSYGFGFGLWWRVGASTAMAIAAGIILVQLPLSAWWLARHRYGPMEWLWRRMTYGSAV